MGRIRWRTHSRHITRLALSQGVGLRKRKAANRNQNSSWIEQLVIARWSGPGILSEAQSDIMKTCWCWKGRHDIPPGEAIMRRRGSGWRRACLHCYGREPEPDRWTLQSCIHCRRPVYLEVRNKWGRKDVQPLVSACNENCRCAARANQRRAGACRPRCCDHCAVEYTPKRMDSRYCSCACKQKAYRKRWRTKVTYP